jgi:multidrug efflux pump subunit AcrA (membrane-fusion protein)
MTPRNRGILIAAIVVALLASLVIWRTCGKKAGEEEEAGNIVVSVQVAKAERSTIANEVTAVATLAPQREAAVAPKISGRIAQLGLLKNRQVRADEVLAVLEARDVAAQRAEAAAAVTEADAAAHSTANGAVPLTNAQDAKAVRDAKAALENARRTLARRETLYKEGGISKKDLEAAQLAVVNAEDDERVAESSSSLHQGVTNPGDVTMANAKARQARDRLAALDAQLGYAAVRAPFNGIVTEQFQYQGDMANPAQKIVTVADTSTLIARMQVGQAAASALKAGDAVTVLADDLPGQPLTGTVQLVGRAADAQSRAVEVWVMVPNADGRLRANGAARVVIAAQSTGQAIVVPTSAVTLDATNAAAGTVMVVDAQSVAHEVHVTTGIRSGGRTQILSGLRGGETVVTEGNYGLPDGTKVALPGAEKAAPQGSGKEKGDE